MQHSPGIIAAVLVLGLATACAGSSAGDGDPASTPPATEPQPAEPSPTEPAPTQPPATEPPSTEPPPTEPPLTDPPPTDPTPTEPPPTEPPPEPSAIAWRTVDVVDPTRPTDEVVREGAVVLEASDIRTIPVEVVYPGAGEGGEGAPPAEAAARPLVIWINGLGGLAAPGDPLLLALYDAGFIVAAPNSPEVSAPAGQFADVPELPADVTAVIDALLDPDDGVADDLSASIDADRIGVAGHSVGAGASLALGYHDCCRDERIDAVAAYGAARLDMNGFAELNVVGAPVLLVGGSADEIAPTSESQAVFDLAQDPDESQAYLLEIAGADHFQPIYDGPDTPVGATSTDALVTFFGVHLAGDVDSTTLEQFGANLDNGTWQES